MKDSERYINMIDFLKDGESFDISHMADLSNACREIMNDIMARDNTIKYKHWRIRNTWKAVFKAVSSHGFADSLTENFFGAAMTSVSYRIDDLDENETEGYINAILDSMVYLSKNPILIEKEKSIVPDNTSMNLKGVDISSDSFKLIWNGIQNSDEYYVRISSDISGKEVLAAKSTAKTFMKVAGLKPQHTYYASIQAVRNDNNVAVYSSPIVIRVHTPDLVK